MRHSLVGPVIQYLWATFALAAVQSGALAAAEGPPPEIVEATELSMVLCQDLGGLPRLEESFQSTLDLNGDGTPDFITDFAGLECTGAEGAFCGTGGCLLSVWLSTDAGRFDRIDLGVSEHHSVVPGGENGLPGLRVHYHGALCDGAADADGGCTRLWRFATNDAETPPVEGGDPPVAGTAVATGEAAAPSGPATELTGIPGNAPGSAAAEAPSDGGAEPGSEATAQLEGDASDVSQAAEDSTTVAPEAAPEVVSPGWTLRAVPGGEQLALGGGVGPIASLSRFCLGGAPFLAVRFTDPPTDETVVFGFEFQLGSVEAEARREAGADGAHVVALEDGQLADGLAGPDRETPVSLDGEPLGALSLLGSTRSIRAALEACYEF